MKDAQTVILALCVWREARGEPRDCKLAVAYSVLNRVARPAWWGKTVLGVLGKKWQYSSLAAPGDPQLILWPVESDSTWQECLDVADSALNNREPNPAPGADSYYDTSISAPDWTKGARFVGKFDRILFWDVDHDYEKAAGGH